MRRAVCCGRSTDVSNAPLAGGLSGSLWLGRQLENCSQLSFAKMRQEYDLAVWKFDRIVIALRALAMIAPRPAEQSPAWRCSAVKRIEKPRGNVWCDWLDHFYALHAEFIAWWRLMAIRS
jgi:hypothetical protein